MTSFPPPLFPCVSEEEAGVLSEGVVSSEGFEPVPEDSDGSGISIISPLPDPFPSEVEVFEEEEGVVVSDEDDSEEPLFLVVVPGSVTIGNSPSDVATGSLFPLVGTVASDEDAEVASEVPSEVPADGAEVVSVDPDVVTVADSVVSVSVVAADVVVVSGASDSLGACVSEAS